MDLYRFGGSAVRLDRVITIKRLKPASGDDPVKVRVYFEGQRAIVFEGPDAEALTTLVDSLPSPKVEPASQIATVLPKLDPKTGKPLARSADRVGGA